MVQLLVVPPLLRNTVLVSPTLEFRQSLHCRRVVLAVKRTPGRSCSSLTPICPLWKRTASAPCCRICSKTDDDELATRPIQLGLVLFGKNVSVYQLGVASGMASADTVRSHEGFLTQHHHCGQGIPDGRAQRGRSAQLHCRRVWSARQRPFGIVVDFGIILQRSSIIIHNCTTKEIAHANLERTQRSSAARAK